jgi:hypothetical protein
MKITKKHMQKIIKEEIQNVLKEQGSATLGSYTMKKSPEQEADHIFAILKKRKGTGRLESFKSVQARQRQGHVSKQRWPKILAALKGRFPTRDGQTWKQFMNDSAGDGHDSGSEGRPPKDAGMPEPKGRQDLPVADLKQGNTPRPAPKPRPWSMKIRQSKFEQIIFEELLAVMNEQAMQALGGATIE